MPRRSPHPSPEADLLDRDLGAAIRRFRTDLGLSQHALAARLSLSGQQLQKYESGANRVSASTLYPWPDPRHMVINLALGIQLAPVLLLWGLASRRDLPRLKIFLTAIFVIMACLTVVTKHMIFPGTVNDANVDDDIPNSQIM